GYAVSGTAPAVPFGLTATVQDQFNLITRIATGTLSFTWQESGHPVGTSPFSLGLAARLMGRTLNFDRPAVLPGAYPLCPRTTDTIPPISFACTPLEPCP